MAYVNEEDKKASQDQQQDQQQNLDQTPMTASAPGAGPSSSSGKSAPQATPAQPFQNLSAYLSANQPQVQEQADRLSGTLAGQYGDTKSSIDQGAADFKNTVQSGYAQDNPALIDQATAAPSDFVKNPQNVAAFQSLYNDQYGGPQNYESSTGYADLNDKVNKATSDAAALGSNGGVKTYFQNQNPNATAGGNLLDSVLLQGTPEAYTKILDAAKPFANLNDYLSNSVTDADNAVTGAKTEAQRIADSTKNKFVGAGGVVPTFQKKLADELSTATGKYTDFNSTVDNINQKISAGQPLTDEEMNLIGMNSYYFNPSNLAENIPAALKSFYDELSMRGGGAGASNPFQPTIDNRMDQPTTLSKYFTPGQRSTVAPTLPGVATSDDAATEKALRQMFGVDAPVGFDPGSDKYSLDGAKGKFDFNKYIGDINSQLSSAGRYVDGNEVSYPSYQRLQGIINGTGLGTSTPSTPITPGFGSPELTAALGRLNSGTATPDDLKLIQQYQGFH